MANWGNNSKRSPASTESFRLSTVTKFWVSFPKDWLSKCINLGLLMPSFGLKSSPQIILWKNVIPLIPLWHFENFLLETISVEKEKYKILEITIIFTLSQQKQRCVVAICFSFCRFCSDFGYVHSIYAHTFAVI